MSTVISTPYSNLTIKPNESLYYGPGPGAPGTFYCFSASNAVSTVPGQPAVITVVNGWANQPSVPSSGPWCMATNTSSSAATFDLVMLTITP